MANDPSPRNYSYDDAVAVLKGLGFQLAPHGGGSHRVWRGVGPRCNVMVGLIEKGHGTLKPYLVRTMVAQLRDAGFID